MPVDAAILEAFGLRGTPVALDGGRGLAWRVGEVVLKPSDFPAESRWRAETLAAVDFSGVRVALPVASAGGDWVAHGWEAWRWVPGEADPTRVDEVVAAGMAFHAALAGVARPSFLDTRTDPWTYGDAVAWREVRAPAEPVLEPLLGALRPVELRAQVVHGDLGGNVLFAAGLPPAVIDWPVYWRPPEWASAVAVVDAVCWEGVSPDAVERWSHLPHWRQMLIRALIYRIATDVARGAEPGEPYRRVSGLVLGSSRGR